MADRTAWRLLLLTVLLFAGQGLVAAGEMARGLVAGQPVVSLGIVNLAIALGLTARLRIARGAGQVLSGATLLFTPIAIVVALTVGLPAAVRIGGWSGLGTAVTDSAPWLALQLGASAFQWSALRAGPVRRLFPSAARADGPARLFPT